MELKELSMMKLELEDSIDKLLNDFHNKTGLKINDLNMTANEFGSLPLGNKIIYTVQTTIKL